MQLLRSFRLSVCTLRLRICLHLPALRPGRIAARKRRTSPGLSSSCCSSAIRSRGVGLCRFTRPTWLEQGSPLLLVGWIAFQFVPGRSAVLAPRSSSPTKLLPYLGPVLMILIPVKLFRPKHIGDYWAMQGIGLLAVSLGCAMANDLIFGIPF